MENPKVSDPNDFKVVQFTNSTDFDFTPEMGCMFDSRPISGVSGRPGIISGENMILPYHVAQRLAINLAKVSFVRADSGKPQLDAQGAPIIRSMWDDVSLEKHKDSFLRDLYSEEKPTAMSQTDLLMAKVEEYKAMVDKLLDKQDTTALQEAQPPADNDHVAPGASQFPASDGIVYQDKAEVIAELEKRGIVHDKRKSKAELEKLLA